MLEQFRSLWSVFGHLGRFFLIYISSLVSLPLSPCQGSPYQSRNLHQLVSLPFSSCQGSPRDQSRSNRRLGPKTLMYVVSWSWTPVPQIHVLTLVVNRFCVEVKTMSKGATSLSLFSSSELNSVYCHGRIFRAASELFFIQAMYRRARLPAQGPFVSLPPSPRQGPLWDQSRNNQSYLVSNIYFE